MGLKKEKYSNKHKNKKAPTKLCKCLILFVVLPGVEPGLF